MEHAYYIYHQSSDINEILHDEKISILYYGDAECEFNFISSIRNTEQINMLFSSKKRLILSTPHFTEITLTIFKKYIEKNPNFLRHFEEITVNDYWLLKVLQDISWSKKINFWNYLFKQEKDPLLMYSPEKDTKQWSININLDTYSEFLVQNNISSVELYNWYTPIDINNIQQISKHMYYPYVSYATTRHCYRSLIHSNKTYLEIVDNCDGCKGKENIKLQQDITPELPVYMNGNKYFYKNTNTNNLKIADRIIYNYDIKKS